MGEEIKDKAKAAVEDEIKAYVEMLVKLEKERHRLEKAQEKAYQIFDEARTELYDLRLSALEAATSLFFEKIGPVVTDDIEKAVKTSDNLILAIGGEVAVKAILPMAYFLAGWPLKWKGPLETRWEGGSFEPEEVKEKQ